MRRRLELLVQNIWLNFQNNSSNNLDNIQIVYSREIFLQCYKTKRNKDKTILRVPVQRKRPELHNGLERNIKKIILNLPKSFKISALFFAFK